MACGAAGGVGVVQLSTILDRLVRAVLLGIVLMWVILMFGYMLNITAGGDALFAGMRVMITLGAFVFGAALLVNRERAVESGWRWLLELDERLRRPLEVLYVITGLFFVAVGLNGLYHLVW